MTTYAEMMQMCRLCLVKEQVNLPIFDGQGEVQQIFLKITACLPVKVRTLSNRHVELPVLLAFGYHADSM